MTRRRRPGADTWRRLARRTLSEVGDDGCTHMAAAIAYYALVSIFPLLILLVSVASLLMQRGAAADRVATAVAAALPVAGPAVSRSLRDVPAVSAGGVGLLGLLGLLWSASGLFGAVRHAINRAFDVDTARPFVQRKLVDVAMAAGTGVFLLASTAAVTAVRVLRAVAAHVPAVGSRLEAWGVLWSLASVAAGFVLTLTVVTVLYRLVPAARLRLRDIWPGILVGTVLVQATQYGFAFYVGSASRYNAVYGSLGTVVAFMVWVYLASLALLVGAEVASEYPRVRAFPPPQTAEPPEAVPPLRRVRGLLVSLVRRR